MTDDARPVRAVVIPADPDQPIIAATVDASRGGLYAILGGQPEPVILGASGALMLCDGYGKSKGSPRNRRATEFAGRYAPGFPGADFIAGPALVLGTDPEDGSRADVPADVERAALDG